MSEAPLPIDAFCTELRQLASVIHAPASFGPSCGGSISHDGLHVGLSLNAARYRLTYGEKGEVALIVESADKDEVMEAVFVEITGNMAAGESTSEPISSDEVLQTPNLSYVGLKASAIDLHVRQSRAQEALLGRLNSRWQARQAIRNANRLAQIEKFFKE